MALSEVKVPPCSVELHWKLHQTAIGSSAIIDQCMFWQLDHDPSSKLDLCRHVLFYTSNKWPMSVCIKLRVTPKTAFLLEHSADRKPFNHFCCCTCLAFHSTNARILQKIKGGYHLIPRMFPYCKCSWIIWALLSSFSKTLWILFRIFTWHHDDFHWGLGIVFRKRHRMELWKIISILVPIGAPRGCAVGCQRGLGSIPGGPSAWSLHVLPAWTLPLPQSQIGSGAPETLNRISDLDNGT